jgi:hypothetical protein
VDIYELLQCVGIFAHPRGLFRTLRGTYMVKRCFVRNKAINAEHAGRTGDHPIDPACAALIDHVEEGIVNTIKRLLFIVLGVI